MPTDGLKWGVSPAASVRAVVTAAHLAPGDPGDPGPEVQRARRVELFRRAVGAGTYRVDSCTIADRLIERRALDVAVEP